MGSLRIGISFGFESDRLAGSIKFGQSANYRSISKGYCSQSIMICTVDEPSKKNWLLDDPVSLELGAMLPTMSLSIESIFWGRRLWILVI